MNHYASTLPESVTYREPVGDNENDSSLGQESVQEQAQEPMLSKEQEPLCYKGDSCSKSCLCPASASASASAKQDQDQDQEPRSITIENEAGEAIVLKAYSTSDENRIMINRVDMSFYEFKGYLADIGMVDDYEMLEKKHWQDMKNISYFSACLGALSVLSLISWFVLLTRALTVVS